MSEGPDLKKLETRMEGALDSLKGEFSGVRSGRASINLLEPVMVSAYGSDMPINQVGTVSVSDARTLAVSVWDKGLVGAVEKGIRDSGLGLNPVTDGQTVRVPLPPMTEERRKELAKMCGKYAEQAKIAIRNVRRDGMEDIKGDDAIPEDDKKRLQDRVQKLTDEKVNKVDEMQSAKEEEIMQV
ncbi:MAG: ribosome recycling factor [Pseudomonadota bacterium]